MKIFTRLSFLVLVLSLSLSTTMLAENRFSVASGKWEDASTWSATRGGAPGAVVPAATDTVYITSGTTVKITASSKKCYNLIVENGGVLLSDQPQPAGSQQYVTVSGDIVKNDGIIGYDPANPTVMTCICFNTVKNIVFTGSGISKISRIRPNTDVSNTTTTIDQDLTLTYSSSSGTGGVGWYGFQGTGTGNTLKINAGKTLTCVDYCYIGVNSNLDTDGPTTTIQVDGTLDMKANGCTMGLRGKAGATVSLIVNGTVEIGKALKPTGTTGVASVITVNGSGVLKIGAAGNGFVYFDSPAQTVTGTGSFQFAGGTMQIGATAGLDPANGPVRTTTRTFSQDATYSFVGAGTAQATGSDFPAKVKYVTLNNPAGSVTLTNNLTVDSLNLKDGNVVTGSNALTLSSNGTVSRTNGYVIGSLVKQIPTGAATATFEVGSASGYSPVSLAFNNVTTAGTLSVAAKEAVHPNAANPNSTLKRYWTIANTGTVFDKYDATFTYTPADFNTDVTEAEEAWLKVANYDGAAWKNLSVGTRTPGSTSDGGSIQVTGLTTLGDFAVLKGSRYVFAEDFDLPAGTLLTDKGWLVASGGTTSALTVADGGLTLSKYVGSGLGNAVPVKVSGQDIYKTFDPVNSGTVYFSFLMNVSAVASGDYFVALLPSTSTSNYFARLHLKSSGSGYQVGISKNNEVDGGAQYGTTVYDLNKTNLVVVKYNFMPADSNDVISVFVLPESAPKTEPLTPEISSYTCSTKPDAADAGAIAIRQGGGAAKAPVLVVDGIRVSTSWDFASSTAATASFSAKTIAFGDVSVGTSKKDSSLVVTNTGATVLNISAVTSSNERFSVTPTTATLNPDAAQKFTITYTPAAAQADISKLVFTSNGVVTSDTVTVTGNGTTTPADTIPVVTIAEARKDADNNFIPDNLDKTFKVKGVVTSIDFTASTTTNNNYFIQDATAGVLLYCKPKLNKPLSIGDSVLVTGKIAQYKGVTEFAAVDTLVGDGGSVQVLKTGAKVPDPIIITVKDLNSEKYEGSLVTVKNLKKTASSKAWPAAKANGNLTVAAGADSTILFIDSDTDIDGTTEPVWPQDITGVVTQYATSSANNDGYELQPRSFADFKATPQDTTPVVTIAEARKDADNNFIPDNLNKVFKVKGVVTSIDFTASTTTNNNYFIQDATAGVLLFCKPKLNKVLNIGDSVLVKGSIMQYKGVTEFAAVDTLVGEGGSVQVLKTGAKVPDPVVISVKDLNSEKYEGMLVTVKNLKKTAASKSWPAEKANGNLTVAAGADSTILFIDSDTDIDGKTEPTWPQDITGVVTQYATTAANNDGYELQPRSFADFKKSIIDAVEENTSKIPSVYSLEQNYPNPFNPTTTIRYSLPGVSNVRVIVYNLIGEVVSEMVNGVQNAGYHEVSFNAGNLSSGIYLYSIVAQATDGSKEFRSVKKMILMK